MTQRKKKVTEDETDGLVDGGLIGEVRLQQLRRQEAAEVSGLVPADVKVINVHHSEKIWTGLKW